MRLHPVLGAAAEGTLPLWSRASPDRVEHMGRVAQLLGDWAVAQGLPEVEIRRWRAAGFLHDALRDADPGEIRGSLPVHLADLPDHAAHGPAAAERLRQEGVTDEPFLRAVSYHTIGHPDLDRFGQALYAADFLEPGRVSMAEWRAGLRVRMVEDPQGVITEVVKVKVGLLLDEERPIRGETCEFWNVLTRELDG